MISEPVVLEEKEETRHASVRTELLSDVQTELYEVTIVPGGFTACLRQPRTADSREIISFQAETDLLKQLNRFEAELPYVRRTGALGSWTAVPWPQRIELAQQSATVRVVAAVLHNGQTADSRPFRIEERVVGLRGKAIGLDPDSGWDVGKRLARVLAHLHADDKKLDPVSSDTLVADGVGIKLTRCPPATDLRRTQAADVGSWGRWMAALLVGNDPEPTWLPFLSRKWWGLSPVYCFIVGRALGLRPWVSSGGAFASADELLHEIERSPAPPAYLSSVQHVWIEADIRQALRYSKESRRVSSPSPEAINDSSEAPVSWKDFRWLDKPPDDEPLFGWQRALLKSLSESASGLIHEQVLRAADALAVGNFAQAAAELDGQPAGPLTEPLRLGLLTWEFMDALAHPEASSRYLERIDADQARLAADADRWSANWIKWLLADQAPRLDLIAQLAAAYRQAQANPDRVHYQQLVDEIRRKRAEMGDETPYESEAEEWLRIDAVRQACSSCREALSRGNIARATEITRAYAQAGSAFHDAFAELWLETADQQAALGGISALEAAIATIEAGQTALNGHPKLVEGRERRQTQLHGLTEAWKAVHAVRVEVPGLEAALTEFQRAAIAVHDPPLEQLVSATARLLQANEKMRHVENSDNNPIQQLEAAQSVYELTDGIEAKWDGLAQAASEITARLSDTLAQIADSLAAQLSEQVQAVVSGASPLALDRITTQVKTARRYSKLLLASAPAASERLEAAVREAVTLQREISHRGRTAYVAGDLALAAEMALRSDSLRRRLLELGPEGLAESAWEAYGETAETIVRTHPLRRSAAFLGRTLALPPEPGAGPDTTGDVGSLETGGQATEGLAKLHAQAALLRQATEQLETDWRTAHKLLKGQTWHPLLADEVAALNDVIAVRRQEYQRDRSRAAAQAKDLVELDAIVASYAGDKNDLQLAYRDYAARLAGTDVDQALAAFERLTDAALRASPELQLVRRESVRRAFFEKELTDPQALLRAREALDVLTDDLPEKSGEVDMVLQDWLLRIWDLDAADRAETLEKILAGVNDHPLAAHVAEAAWQAGLLQAAQYERTHELDELAEHWRVIVKVFAAEHSHADEAAARLQAVERRRRRAHWLRRLLLASLVVLVGSLCLSSLCLALTASLSQFWQ